ncbi:sodium:proton exchanger [bacterium]|nr:sodium:proton exchanger [bacterium]
MFSVTIFLSLFSLLLLSMGVFFLSKKFNMPYTVLLLISGLLLIPISEIGFLSFLSKFELTSELLFFIFLPTLIFESAFNIEFKKFWNNKVAIFSLSIFGFLASTFLIAGGLYYILPYIGFELPFIFLVLFGTIISATDPVAVLALFKEYGAPKRLAMIFEGESLFNDATSLAVFLIVLEIILKNGHVDLLGGLLTFASMLIGGALFGTAIGFGFSKIIEKIRNYQNVEITLTMVVAHLTFIMAEILSETLVLGGFEVKISSIVATVCASIVIGNYGRYKISPQIEIYMHKFWDYFAFISNSLVFVMMGIKFATLVNNFHVFWPLVIMTILVCSLVRIITVYPTIGLCNLNKKEAKIPRKWQHLLAFGDLKGALAVILLLLVPADFTIEGYNLGFNLYEVLTAMTVGVIFFTLLFKATFLGRLMDKLGINKLTKLEKLEYLESKAIIFSKVLNEVNKFQKRGYITTETHRKLKAKYSKLYEKAYKTCGKVSERNTNVFKKMLLVYAIGIEKHSLKNLLIQQEVTEKVFRYLNEKLNYQMDLVEANQTQIYEFKYKSNGFVRKYLPYFDLKTQIHQDPKHLFTYYRALRIISIKVLEELNEISKDNHLKDFDKKEVFYDIIKNYEKFLKQSTKKMKEILSNNKRISYKLDENFAQMGIHTVEEKIINDLSKKEMITPKLNLLLREQILDENA